jgi:hypothetical protein
MKAASSGHVKKIESLSLSLSLLMIIVGVCGETSIFSSAVVDFVFDNVGRKIAVVCAEAMCFIHLT